MGPYGALWSSTGEPYWALWMPLSVFQALLSPMEGYEALRSVTGEPYWALWIPLTVVRAL